MLRRAGQAAARLGCAVLATGFAIVVLALLTAGGLAWRLSRGSIDLDPFVPRIEAAGPPGLRIGHATLAWQGWRRGDDRPLQVALDAVRLDGAEAARAAVSLSLPYLLFGRVVPRTIEVDDARLTLHRDAEGRLSVGSPDASGPKRDEPLFPAALAQLQRLRVRAALTVIDDRLGTTWQVPLLEADLHRRPGNGVSGTARLRATLGEGSLELTAAAAADPDGRSRIALHLEPLTPNTLAAAPGLTPLHALAVPVSADATIELAPDWALRGYEARLQAGEGTLSLAGGETRLLRGTVELRGDAARLELRQASAVLAPGADRPPSTVSLSGTATRDASGVQADGELALDRAAFADLPQLWPPSLAGHARAWIVENITTGTAHDGRFRIRVAAAPDLSRPRIVSASGRMQAENLTVSWLRPVPPLDRGQATLVLQDPDTVAILVQTAHQGAIAVRGRMLITGLTAVDQYGDIETQLDGSVPDALALLRHPRLRLLSRRPITLNDPAGTVSGTLGVRLMLDSRVTAEQIAITVQADLAGVHLGGVVARRDLDDGTARLNVTNDGLALTGRAELAGIPADLRIRMDFRDGPPDQLLEQITAAARPSGAQLTALGANPGGVIAGTPAVTLSYAQRRDGDEEVRLRADLTDAALTVAQAGWSKPAGIAGHAAAAVQLRDGQVRAIEAVHAEAPGLQLDGRAAYENGRASTLHLDRIALGRTHASGEVRLPGRDGEPVRATLSGPLLDLAGLGRSPDRSTGPVERGGSADLSWMLDARFDQVLLPGGALPGVVAHAESDGTRLRAATLDTAGPERARLSLAPDGDGRCLTGSAADAGLLLRIAGVTDAVQGGAAELRARFDDARPDHRLDGTLEATEFHLHLSKARRGSGIGLRRLVAPFRYADGVATLHDARAYNAAIGATARGQIDVARGRIDLTGTLVPAYAVNSLPGRIPLLGRLFSPERGGGLFAASYGLHGSLDDPDVSVNPLSALLPGVLRRMLDLLN